MKEGWKLCRLEDLGQIMYGHTAKSSFEKNGPKYLRITDIQKGIVDWESVPNCSPFEDYQKYGLKKGDIVFARTGATTGKSYLIEDEVKAVFASYLIRVEIKTTDLSPKFLYLFFQTPQYWHNINTGISGSAQGGFNAKKLGQLNIPIPQIGDQKEIVALLGKAFAAIDQAQANIEKNIENAKELFQFKLNEIFSQKGEGWEEKTLGNVCDLISGQHIASNDYNNEKEGIGYLTGPSDFGAVFPVVSKWTKVPKRVARKNDILITVKGSGVGSINLMAEKELCISRQLMAIRCREVETDYLYSFLTTQYKYFQSLSNGAAIPGISRSDVLGLKLSIPDPDVQRELVMKITRIRNGANQLIGKYHSKLLLLEELKKSLLQKAFSGELTQKDLVL